MERNNTLGSSSCKNRNEDNQHCRCMEVVEDKEVAVDTEDTEDTEELVDEVLDVALGAGADSQDLDKDQDVDLDEVLDKDVGHQA